MQALDSANVANRFNDGLNLSGTPGQATIGGALVAAVRKESWICDFLSPSAINRFSYRYTASAEL
jgi:hypothetical protein